MGVLMSHVNFKIKLFLKIPPHIPQLESKYEFKLAVIKFYGVYE